MGKRLRTQPYSSGTRFPKKGDVYEATGDVEVNYLTSWSAPFTGGGSGILKKGERVIIDYEPLPRPIAANAKAINYTHVEEGMVPEVIARTRNMRDSIWY
jgi:hypothetical protein